MKFCIGIPAIIDDEVVSKAVATHVENICKVNKEVSYIVNIDDYKYKNAKGSVESCEKIYRNIEKSGKDLHLTYGSPRKGLNLAYKDILKTFLETDGDILIFFDDDHNIINPLIFETVPRVFYEDDTKVVHFANTYLKCSGENPFLGDVIFENEKIQVRSNKGKFYTQPGTCLTRKLVEKILSNYDENSPQNSEDIVGNNSAYRENDVVTVVSKNQKEPVVSEEGRNQGFVIPMECHFSCDTRRFIKATGSEVGHN